MKHVLFLLTALAQAPAVPQTALPPQSSDIASMEPGELAKCSANEGCIVLTKTAMARILSEAMDRAAKACANSKKGWPA